MITINNIIRLKSKIILLYNIKSNSKLKYKYIYIYIYIYMNMRFNSDLYAK